MALKKTVKLQLVNLSKSSLDDVQVQINEILEADPFAEIDVTVVPTVNPQLFIKVSQKSAETEIERKSRELAETVVSEITLKIKEGKSVDVHISKKKIKELQDALVGDNSPTREVKKVKE